MHQTFIIGGVEYEAYWYKEKTIKYRYRNEGIGIWSGWFSASKGHPDFNSISEHMVAKSA